MIDGRKLVAVIAAGGSGKRMGMECPKQFISIDGIPMLARSVLAFSCVQEVDHILVVAPAQHLEESYDVVKKVLDEKDPEYFDIIPGGEERQESIRLALSHLQEEDFDENTIVLIHDAARPYVSMNVILRVAQGAMEDGAAIPCVTVKDTVRSLDETLDRKNLRAVQTPQAFNLGFIYRLHEMARETGFKGTDDASLMEGEFAKPLLEKYSVMLTLVDGDERNIKITTPADLPDELQTETNVIRVDKVREGRLRTGLGFDVHRLVEGRRLILGGVEIPYSCGLLGHSDADVLTHAVMDALLGASGLGDIGELFPDSDERYRGANSIDLLKKVGEKVRELGYEIMNIDSIIVAQAPKLAPFKKEMEKNMAEALALHPERVCIKATTTEGLGFEGRGEGMSARAICLLHKICD